MSRKTTGNKRLLNTEFVSNGLATDELEPVPIQSRKRPSTAPAVEITDSLEQESEPIETWALSSSQELLPGYAPRRKRPSTFPILPESIDLTTGSSSCSTAVPSERSSEEAEQNWNRTMKQQFISSKWSAKDAISVAAIAQAAGAIIHFMVFGSCF